METQQAHELGADHFLNKPFEHDELVAIVKETCAAKLQVPEALARVAPIEYCKVSLEEFVSAEKISFDVYVKLGSRFVKIGRRGDDVPRDRIAIYREKGLKHLFISKEDFRELVNFNLKLAKTVASAQKVSKEKKTNFMRYTGEIILEKAFVEGVDEEAFNDAKNFLTTSMDILTDDDETFNILESLNSHSDHLYAHSLCVSIYSSMIAKEMGWTSASNLFKLSLAGIFHDIGKKEIDRALLDKARPLLNHSERKEIESHAERGREILLMLPQIPSEVVAVAYEHHENILATGYPRSPGRHTIHPMSHIVHVADLFAEFTLRGPNNHQGMSANHAIQHLIAHYRESCLPEPFNALCRICKVALAS
jgi:putative nucleotidyltransferase with HDIG domain